MQLQFGKDNALLDEKHFTMNDREFKRLGHRCQGFNAHSYGKQIASKYSPDVSLCCGNQYWIIEHESEPNRKTIIADIAKAAHFLSGTRIGALLIVLTPKGGSSFRSYAEHCKGFLRWIKTNSNLKEVHFISPENYYDGVSVLAIGSEQFFAKCVTIS